MAEPAADPGKFDEAIAAWRRRVPMVRSEWDTLADDEKEFAFTVSAVAELGVIAEIWRALDSAIENGDDFDDFKRDVGERLADAWGNERPGALETVFRTNVLGAYSAGRYAIYSAPAAKEARPYLRFDAIHDDRTDDDCEACDDTVLPQDDPWWARNTPPLHFQCRCQVTPLSKDEVDDLDGPDDEGPAVAAADGFGGLPSEEGDDWNPGENFPPPLLNILNEKIAR